jgi:hypothetical protein
MLFAVAIFSLIARDVPVDTQLSVIDNGCVIR